MLMPQVAARLETEIPALAKRVFGAAQLSGLMARNALPQVTPAAFVLPLGLGVLGSPDAGASAWTQMVDERIGVVLVIRVHGDATGGSGLADLAQLVEAVLAALAGWDPGDTITGVLRFTGSNLTSLSAGTIVYELNFAIENQLRVTA